MSTENQSLVLGNKVYDRAKFVVQIVLPALAVLYTTLAQFWGFPAVEGVVGTITALALFLGTILGISSKNYSPEESDPGAPVGEFIVTESEDGRKTVTLELKDDPEKYADGDVMRFEKKVRSENSL